MSTNGYGFAYDARMPVPRPRTANAGSDCVLASVASAANSHVPRPTMAAGKRASAVPVRFVTWIGRGDVGQHSLWNTSATPLRSWKYVIGSRRLRSDISGDSSDA